MRNIAKTILFSAGILLSLTGCQKGTTVGGGKNVTFKASTKTQETRTTFGDVYTENNIDYQRIKWVEGDKILVWSDNAVVKDDLTHPSFSSNNTNIATYSVANIRDEEERVSPTLRTRTAAVSGTLMTKTLNMLSGASIPPAR